MTVRAVVFDFFGTLTPTVTEMATVDERTEIARLLGVDHRALERAWQESYTERATGRIGGVLDSLRVLAGRLGAHPDQVALERAAEIRSAAYRRTARPRPETVPVLTALRDKGFPIGLVSDCSMELVELWPTFPFAPLVTAAVFSALVGRRKPDPVLYQLASDGVGVPPEDCLFVGDGGSNELTGAAKAGMRPVLIADEDWAFGHRYQGEDAWTGERISALPEVLDLVAG